MPLIDSGWRYYVPDQGETADDAREIQKYDWRGSILSAEWAAENASEDDWDNHDGWHMGCGPGPVIVVIAPDGNETWFTTEREATIVHSVKAID